MHLVWCCKGLRIRKCTKRVNYHHITIQLHDVSNTKNSIFISSFDISLRTESFTFPIGFCFSSFRLFQFQARLSQRNTQHPDTENLFPLFSDGLRPSVTCLCPTLTSSDTLVLPSVTKSRSRRQGNTRTSRKLLMGRKQQSSTPLNFFQLLFLSCFPRINSL